MLLDCIVKVLAPILANCEVNEFFKESIAVRIPTRAIIPNAIIKTVNTVRNIFERTELIAIRKFSLNNRPTLIKLIPT
ncbi:MAG: hypothetical protein Kow0068_20730 [Marinilabiliales bacterium]